MMEMHIPCVYTLRAADDDSLGYLIQVRRVQPPEATFVSSTLRPRTHTHQIAKYPNERRQMVTDTHTSLPPRVGIYWGIIHSTEDLELVTDMTSLAEAERYGEFLTHPRGHYDVWEAWRRSGPRGLARLKLPKLITWTEYETLPRGRVVYHVSHKHFTIYADRRLQRTSFSQKIANDFGLASSSYSIASDTHYSDVAL